MKSLFALAAALVLLLAGCAQAPARGEGFVEGRVTIGPLCPVEPCQSPPDMDAVYGNRSVVAYRFETKQKVSEADLSSSGSYFMALEAGRYILDVTDREGKELDPNRRPQMGEATPQEIEVMAGNTTVANFDIDTGIR